MSCALLCMLPMLTACTGRSQIGFAEFQKLVAARDGRRLASAPPVLVTTAKREPAALGTELRVVEVRHSGIDGSDARRTFVADRTVATSMPRCTFPSRCRMDGRPRDPQTLPCIAISEAGGTASLITPGDAIYVERSRAERGFVVAGVAVLAFLATGSVVSRVAAAGCTDLSCDLRAGTAGLLAGSLVGGVSIPVTLALTSSEYGRPRAEFAPARIRSAAE